MFEEMRVYAKNFDKGVNKVVNKYNVDKKYIDGMVVNCVILWYSYLIRSMFNDDFKYVKMFVEDLLDDLKIQEANKLAGVK